MQQEFSIFGLNAEKMAIGAGFFLVVWGCSVSVLGGSQSITSFIPTFLGAPLLFFGYMARAQPNRRTLWMHIVALITLLTFLGGLDFFRPIFAGQNPFSNPLAALSKLMLVCVGGVALFSCIGSFVWARKNKVESSDGPTED